MARTATAEPCEPPWTADLLAYEVAWLATSDPARRLLVRRFADDPRPLMAAVARDAAPGALPGATLAVWVRAWWGGRVWHAVVRLPW